MGKGVPSFDSKTGRNRLKASSFRSISLLNAVGKLLKNMIIERRELDERKELPLKLAKQEKIPREAKNIAFHLQ